MEELKIETGDRIKILKIDVDKNPGATSLPHTSVPTLILFKKGEIKWQQSGVVPAQKLEQIIKHE